LLTRRGNSPAKTVRIAKPKDAHAPDQRRLRVQHGAGLFRGGGDAVECMGGLELQRDPSALPAFAFRAVVLREENSNGAGTHRHGEQASVALVLTIDDESKRVPVPVATAEDVRGRERRLDALRDDWRIVVGHFCGALRYFKPSFLP